MKSVHVNCAVALVVLRRISVTVANFVNSGRGTNMGTDTHALSTVENVPAGTLLLSLTVTTGDVVPVVVVLVVRD